MTGMVYERVKKAADWNPQHNNTEQKQKIKPKSASTSGLSAQERIDSLPNVPANWMELDPVYRRIQAKAAAMQLASSQKSDDSPAVNTDAIQMKCSQCEEKEKVQLNADGETQLSADDSHEQVQLHGNGQTPSKLIQQVAAQGFSGSARRLPHLNKIQQSFGVNLSHVQAYIGGRAAAACNQMRAAAYASGNQIAFKEAPSVELAAHEAAHVVQQQSGKVQLSGGVGQVGDKYEQHADEVAARVGAGQSAGDLLAEYTKSTSQQTSVQKAILIQRQSSGSIPVIPSVPLCGQQLTHLEVLPARDRDLEPCLPAGIPVRRINIVGRQFIQGISTGNGRQIFNLHIGFYKEPATNRICLIASDSRKCIAAECDPQGCFATLDEAINAFNNYLQQALEWLGASLSVVLSIIMFFIKPLLNNWQEASNNQEDLQQTKIPIV